MADSIRLVFEFRDGKFVPLPPQKVEMVSAHDTSRDLTPSDGRFLELRSADGEALRSVRVAGAGPPSVEFPSNDPEKPFGRTEPPPGAILSVVVEADERATHAALVEVSSTGAKDLEGPAKRDLAVVPLPKGDEQ
jgi:hypothetical protein